MSRKERVSKRYIMLTDDLRITAVKELTSPKDLLAEMPASEACMQTIANARTEIHNILYGNDDRLLIVVGPCSIHDPKSAMEYAEKLAQYKKQHEKELCVVMRVYFEKPRTTVGWKGLINDPDLNNTFDINKGLRLARQLLLDVNALGLPAGTEFLDLISPQYVADLIAWGAIGARTTESQTHRELSSGLSCPVGFKNATDGDVQVAVDAINSASRPHNFLSVTKEGKSAIFSTAGNEDCHLILRGGRRPNYDMFSVDDCVKSMEKGGLRPNIMIDASHANSRKIPARQLEVTRDIARQVAHGNQHIMGLMLESHLVEGRQNVEGGIAKTYGQSITDPCMSWDNTTTLLNELAESVKQRRAG